MSSMEQSNMTSVQQVNIQCDCHHRRGLLYVVRPWAWGSPCRRCRRAMERNLVVVPASGGAAIAVNGDLGRRRRRRSAPIVVATTTTSVPQVQQQFVNVPQTPQQYDNAPRVVLAENTTIATPAQTALDWQRSQEAFPSSLPPKYDHLVAAN